LGTGRTSTTSWVLLTGATGFLGQCLLGELLDRRYRVLAIVRAGAPAEARSRLGEAMKPWGRDIEAHLESGQLAILRGELLAPDLGVSQDVLRHLRGTLASVVHAAGNTTFRKRPDGEPARTNVEGSREVFRFASACECLDWHLISTAYVCGKVASGAGSRAAEAVQETPVADQPEFRNEYERSKWLAELQSAEAASDTGATLSIYRPSVVVGHSSSGVATRFVGICYLFRAVSLIAQAAAQRADLDRRRIPLRIRADADSGANLVFADDLARDFVDIFARRAARGGVYHLTHPAAPSNEQIRRAVESYYDVSGGRFVSKEAPAAGDDRTSFEEIFDDLTGGISTYLFDSPVFDRCHTDAFSSRPPTAWNEQRLHRLIAYAESVGWRAARTELDPHAELIGFEAFFERFLPTNVALSKIGRLSQLNVDVRFQIEGGVDGDWWCRFRNGRVVEVRRAPGLSADVVFRTTPVAFWRAVGGEVTGPEMFLSGDARIEGDIERGLKFAMILEQFVREFPCDRQGLLAHDA